MPRPAGREHRHGTPEGVVSRTARRHHARLMEHPPCPCPMPISDLRRDTTGSRISRTVPGPRAGTTSGKMAGTRHDLRPVAPIVLANLEELSMLAAHQPHRPRLGGQPGYSPKPPDPQACRRSPRWSLARARAVVPLRRSAERSSDRRPRHQLPFGSHDRVAIALVPHESRPPTALGMPPHLPAALGGPVSTEEDSIVP